MTRDDVALLAAKAGYDELHKFGDEWLDRLVVFAKLVRAYQRTHVTYSCPVCSGTMIENSEMELATPPCSTHPDAPHGFDRTGSHSLGRYVCLCESWS